MAKAQFPKTAQHVLGHGDRRPDSGGGTPVTRTAPKGSDNKPCTSKTASTNRTPTGRSVGGNW